MKGQILNFSAQSNSGAISGEDGERYSFDGSDWQGNRPPARGMSVDFTVEGNQAKDIYVAVSRTSSLAASMASSGKSKTTAGLLGIFLGHLGIHKFYLGFTGPGLVFLLINTVGWTVSWMLLWIPHIIVGIIAFIEGIIYLTKSDEEFEQIYVIGKRKWF